ncbi:MAG TPA: hypothetical protein PK062_07400, partial [Clostridia bacterium]|nr:hypothetical protein [Clostridia bacterium]
SSQNYFVFFTVYLTGGASRAALIGLLTAAVLFAAAAVLCYLYTDEIIGWVRSLVEKLMSMAA